ncbi:hypothetical protein LEMLEM_LOCUS10189 [Lemmus lemmus]
MGLKAEDECPNGTEELWVTVQEPFCKTGAPRCLVPFHGNKAWIRRLCLSGGSSLLGSWQGPL